MIIKIPKRVYEKVNSRLRQPQFNIQNKEDLQFALGYITCLTDLEIKMHGRLTGDFQINPEHVAEKGDNEND